MAEDIEPRVTVTPDPDPTVYTNEAIQRAIKALREWAEGQFAILVTRLDGMDEATTLRHNAMLKDVADTPKQIGAEIQHLKDLTEQRFEALDEQLVAIEAQRVEQKTDSKIGLDAALSAQKEGAREQNASNTLAINKSEAAMVEQITTNARLSATEIKALAGIVDDVKQRLVGIEAARNGASEQRTESRAQVSTSTAVIGAVVAIVAALGLYLGTQDSGTTVVEPPPVTVTVPAP